MYGNKVAAAIKVNGQVLREFKDTVYIPFGSEYSILIKNLHSQRAVVNVYIDGDNAVPNGLVIGAFQEIELERKIVNNNLSEGNRFKFIERTEGVEQHRGIKLEDGLIRVEHQFEQPPVQISQWNNSVLRGIPWGQVTASGATFSPSTTYSTTSASLNNVTVSAQGASTSAYVNDTGITVPGSKSTQSFSSTYVGTLESTTHSMVIKLVGDLGNNKPVAKPVTVKQKPKCVTCGRQNKASAKFCQACGTALEIFA